MSFGYCPIANIIRKRTVNKTEFDTFKQKCGIDLVSLKSYDEGNNSQIKASKFNVRPSTVHCTNARRTTYVVKARARLYQNSGEGQPSNRNTIWKSVNISDIKISRRPIIQNKTRYRVNKKVTKDDTASVGEPTQVNKTNTTCEKIKSRTGQYDSVNHCGTNGSVAYSDEFEIQRDTVQSDTVHIKYHERGYVDNDAINSKDSGFSSIIVSPEYDNIENSIGDFGVFESDSKKEISNFHNQVQFEFNNASHLNKTSLLDDSTEKQCLGLIEINEDAQSNIANGNDLNDTFKKLAIQKSHSGLCRVIKRNCSYLEEEVNSMRDLTTAVLEPKEESFDRKVKKEANRNQKVQNMTMSREARHALFETLQDMNIKKKHVRYKDNNLDDIRDKSLNPQRHIKDKCNNCDHHTRERSISFLRNHFQSMDSLGNDENSSISSVINDCDDSSDEDTPRGKLFPTIVKENNKISKITESTTRINVYPLQTPASQLKYKIPGIGNYNLITDTDVDFKITPLGFDIRYEPRPVISKDELDEMPPKYVRENSIQKCKKWLKNLSLSSQSLKPANHKKF